MRRPILANLCMSMALASSGCSYIAARRPSQAAWQSSDLSVLKTCVSSPVLHYTDGTISVLTGVPAVILTGAMIANDAGGGENVGAGAALLAGLILGGISALYGFSAAHGADVAETCERFERQVRAQHQAAQDKTAIPGPVKLP